MRKLQHAKIEDLKIALKRLGYRMIRSNEIMEFINPPFHLYVSMRRQDAILRLHIDVYKPLPPFHRGVSKGKKVRKEYNAIVDAYKKIRGKPVRR